MAAKKDREDNSQRILTAVNTILAKEGYAGATVNQVAARAGVSRGLLHYYFKNKEDMMAQAVKAGASVSLGVIEEVFQREQTAEELAQRFCDGLKRISAGDPDFIHLLLESWAVSRRSEAVAAELRANYRLFREAVCRKLEEAVAEKRISPAMPIQALASLLVGLFDGLGLQFVTEPDLLSDQELLEAVQAAVSRLLSGG